MGILESCRGMCEMLCSHAQTRPETAMYAPSQDTQVRNTGFFRQANAPHMPQRECVISFTSAKLPYTPARARQPLAYSALHRGAHHGYQ